MRRLLFSSILVSVPSASLAAILASCGGASTTGISSSQDGGSDATTSPPFDGQSPEDASNSTDTGAGDAADASPPCAAPVDPTKSAVCLTLAPEAITFIPSDPALDGKGLLVVEAFDTSVPGLADGGTATPLATVVLGQGDAGGPVDLSSGPPLVRIDGLPSTVYLRAIFVDNPTPPKGLGYGDWLAGYVLADGLYTGVPLRSESLPTGQGTSVSLDLRALRKLTVTMSLATTPAGNAQGPAEFLALDSVLVANGAHVFGLGTSTCADVSDGGTADVVGFVLGNGPYYVTGWVDDFGTYAGGPLLPPGALAALEVEPDGGAQIPAADAVTYAADAYRIAKQLPLGLLIAGDAGADTVSCP